MGPMEGTADYSEKPNGPVLATRLPPLPATRTREMRRVLVWPPPADPELSGTFRAPWGLVRRKGGGLRTRGIRGSLVWAPLLGPARYSRRSNFAGNYAGNYR